MAVTDLAAAYATLGLGLTGTEWREVIVKEEAHVALVEHIVHHLLIELCSECTGSKRLCLTTCEDRTSMRHRQRRNLAPDRTDLVCLTTVETDSLVEDAAAHGIAHHVVVILVHQGSLLLQLLLREVSVCSCVSLLEVSKNLVEGILTGLLVESLLHHLVSLGVKLLVDLLAQVLVVHLVAVLTLHVGAELLHQFCLQLTHRTDSLLGSLQGSEQILLRNLLHLALNHHDVLGRSSNHQVHVSLLHLLEGRVDYVFSIDACHTYFRNRALERNI